MAPRLENSKKPGFVPGFLYFERAGPGGPPWTGGAHTGRPKIDCRVRLARPTRLRRKLCRICVFMATDDQNLLHLRPKLWRLMQPMLTSLSHYSTWEEGAAYGS